MKYCERPFKQAYIFPNGDVRACGWTYQCIGNLLDESMEEIWSGEKAEVIRETVRDGSYSLCNHVSCPYLANDSLPDVTEEDFLKFTVAPKLPTEINAAYDYICNNSCPSCRHEIFKPDEQYKKNMQIISDKLVPILENADMLSTDGNGDCFASPYIMGMLERIKPKKAACEVRLESNGVLCDAEHWEKLEHLYKNDIQVTITPNSFDRLAYKYLSGGHDFLGKVIDNLHFLKGLRKSGKIKKFDISIVVQDRNYRELPGFTRRCIEEFECDSVVIKPVFYWFALTHEEYWFKDILNPKHPYFSEYMEILKEPILQHPKVFFWGGDHVHETKDHPATDYKVYFDAFAVILKNKYPKETLEKAMLVKGFSKVALYGVNDNAELIYNLLSGTKIEVVAVIDKYAKVDSFCGLPVIMFDTFDPKLVSTIIVSNYIFIENITRDLKFHRFTGNILPFDSIIEG